MSDTKTHPPGEYAIVELFGHTMLDGREWREMPE